MVISVPSGPETGKPCRSRPFVPSITFHWDASSVVGVWVYRRRRHRASRCGFEMTQHSLEAQAGGNDGHGGGECDFEDVVGLSEFAVVENCFADPGPDQGVSDGET